MRSILKYQLGLTPSMLAMMLVSLAGQFAVAQCQPVQIANIIEGSTSDNTNQFGEAVAISGTTAVVGDWGYEQNGTRGVGSLFVFDARTGQQLAILVADDGENNDHLGYSVAIDGTTAIAGAPQDDDNGDHSGSAYIFDTTTGQQLAKLLPSDGAAGDAFGQGLGQAVAISGTTAIVGAHLNDDNGESSGSAYLFDTTTGQQTFKLLPDDNAAGDQFGFSVAISGAIAIVGAWFTDDNGEDSGSAYLFDTTTGEQTFKLLPDDGAASDFFGHSVAISGNRAVVGAIGDDDNGERSGSAYVFDTTTGQQIAKLLPQDGGAGDWFGQSVSISGNTAVVGSYYADDNFEDSGSAYLFDIRTGQQIAKFAPPGNGAYRQHFGYCASISGVTAIIGTNQYGFGVRSAVLFDVSSCIGTDVFPDSLLTTRGSYVSGGIAELATSDNADLSLQRATSDIQSRTEFEVKAVSPVASPASFEVSLEGAVFARSTVNQTIELYDYVAGQWEQVDTRPATRFTDSMVTVAATGDLSRFVEPGTRCIQARIRYQSPVARQQFSSNTDQFIWTIGQ